MVGKTTPVPVATAFVSDTLASSLGQKISTGLIETAIHPQVPQVLGSLTGFIPLPTEPAAAKQSSQQQLNVARVAWSTS